MFLTEKTRYMEHHRSSGDILKLLSVVMYGCCQVSSRDTVFMCIHICVFFNINFLLFIAYFHGHCHVHHRSPVLPNGCLLPYRREADIQWLQVRLNCT